MKTLKLAMATLFATIFLAFTAYGMLGHDPRFDYIELALVSFALSLAFATAYIMHVEKPEKEIVTTNERTDLVATRQWVEQVVNAKTSNLVAATGHTVTTINSRLQRLETLNRQGGYLAFIEDKAVLELGFDKLCGSLFHGDKFYPLFDVKMTNGLSGEILQATIVEKDDPRWKAVVDANYDHVCSNYGGRGSEMSMEVKISKEVADGLVEAYLQSKK